MKRTTIALSIGSALLMASGAASACYNCQSSYAGSNASGVIGNSASASSLAVGNGFSISGARQSSSLEVNAFSARTDISGRAWNADSNVTKISVDRPYVSVTRETNLGMSRTEGTVVESGASVAIKTDGAAFNISRGFATGHAVAMGGGVGSANAHGVAYDWCRDLSAGYGLDASVAAGNIEVAGRNDFQVGGASAHADISGVAGIVRTSGVQVKITDTDTFKMVWFWPVQVGSDKVTEVTRFENKSAFVADSKTVGTSAYQFGNGFGLSGAMADAYGSGYAFTGYGYAD